MEIPEQFETINKELNQEANNIEDELKLINENKEEPQKEEKLVFIINYENYFQEETIEQIKSKEKAEEFKNKGNEFYYNNDTNEVILRKLLYFMKALCQYEQALDYCPDEETKLLSIIYYNIALCYFKHDDLESVIQYCTSSIKLNQNYVKPLKKRVEIYEKLEKYEECLEDLKKLKELVPDDKEVLYKLPRIEQKYNIEFEKKKNEAIDGLKSLANKALNYFGMDINNFKLQQNENGSYNINYQNQ